MNTDSMLIKESDLDNMDRFISKDDRYFKIEVGINLELLYLRVDSVKR
jgi:hypothetical protein